MKLIYKVTLRLALILPCRDQDAHWSDFDRTVYSFVLEQADSVFYLHDEYTQECMHERNRALASGADFCVAYMNQPNGGTAYTVNLAEKSGITVWECRNCGHIAIGVKSPEVCPVCAHPQAYFEIREENY